jgi:glycerate-2-kinase
VTTPLLSDARAISAEWLNQLDLVALTEQRLGTSGLLSSGVAVDVVAIGKASREMRDAAAVVLGERLLRRLTICDEASAANRERTPDVIVGEHPIPGEGSLRAGAALLSFLDEPTRAGCTLFLLSGGASSLCVVPEPPVTLEDLHGVWDAAMTSGVDITTLNQLRASTSAISGGGVLRHVRTTRSQSLILVDNVISGPAWVASGLTYDYRPSDAEVTMLLERVGLEATPLGQKVLAASRTRDGSMTEVATLHENVVLAEPSMMLDAAAVEARRRGYRVVDMGSQVHGDVADVSEAWSRVLRAEGSASDAVALLGVGEVTVRVHGTGTGGRCQEFAWLMAKKVGERERDTVFVARASDGRDFVEGVGGAWVDRSTMERARQLGIDWSDVAEANDTHTALGALGQLLEGGHTGWNLCDLYVALT